MSISSESMHDRHDRYDETDTAEQGLTLIDTDVHHIYRDAKEVIRHLPRYHQQWGLQLPGRPGLSNPHGVGRRDAVPDEGGRPGSSLAKMREQLLDAYDMDYAILNDAGIISVGVHADADYAAALARAHNEWFAEAWLDADSRLLGSIVVAHNNPEESAKEIRRIGAHPRLVQVLMTSASRTPFGDRFYWPIYEAACEMNLPVAVHPGAECTGVANPFVCGWPASYLEWHTNLSQNYMGQLTSLVCRGVFNQFPTLRFVCLEGGIGWLPHLMWRLDKNWKALRSTAPWLERPPSEYLVEHVRLSTQPIEEPERGEHLLQVFEMAHAERTVMFSSDYPHWDNDCPLRGLPRFTQPLKDRILFKNAQELYGLPDKANKAPAGDH